MTYESLRASIASIVNANWSTITPIAWPNFTYVPQVGVAYIEPFISIGEEMEGEIGEDGVGIRVGVLTIIIYVPVNGGTKTGFSYADTLESIFRRKTISDIMFNNCTATDGGKSVDGMFYKVNFRVPFNTFVGE